MQEIMLHTCGPADVDRVMAVAPGLFDHAPIRDQTVAFLADPANALILALAGDQAVGFCSATILRHPDKPPAMFINEVGVREAWQRQGIGKQVTQAMITLARTRGCQGIWLGTEADNLPALALYRSLRGDEVPGVYFGWDDGV